MKRIAIIPGDGIGPEVIREAMKVLAAVRHRCTGELSVDELPFGADHYLATGETLPEDAFRSLRDDYAAILIGAMGDPRVPGNEHARDILLGLRFRLDLYVNERPARLVHERLTPLKGKTPADIDLTIFRENTEGLYNSIGGSFKTGSADEIFVAEEINTRKGVERIVRHAFAWAARHRKTRVTLADKSNAIPAHGLWRRVFREVSAEYPDINSDARYIDAMAMDLIRTPETFQVIVTGNLFGDILSDLASMLVGGLGIAPSANINPQGNALFEPVHGSAPPLTGTDRANPIAAILSLGMLLAHLGEAKAASAISQSVDDALQQGVGTSDVGGTLGTAATGDWISQRASELLSRDR